MTILVQTDSTEFNIVYVFTCNVKYDEYKCWTKHAFVYDIQFKPFHKSKYCGDIIDNRYDAPILVLEDKYIEKTLNFIYSIKELFGSLYHVGYFYKITPCWLILIIYIYLLTFRPVGSNHGSLPKPTATSPRL